MLSAENIEKYRDHLLDSQIKKVQELDSNKELNSVEVELCLREVSALKAKSTVLTFILNADDETFNIF